MTALLWIATSFLLALWSGCLYLGHQLTAWALQGMAQGAGVDWSQALGDGAWAAWLAPWLDPAWLQATQLALTTILQGLGPWLTVAPGLMAWITPLVWVVWAMGAMVLVAAAGAGHWWLRRRAGHKARLQPGH